MEIICCFVQKFKLVLQFCSDENVLYAGLIIKHTLYFLVKSLGCQAPIQLLLKMFNTSATGFDILRAFVTFLEM